MNLSQLAWSAIGFLLTVMVLSYLIGDNLFFRLAAYLFIGLTAGYLTVLLVNRVLLPHMVLPLISGSGPERWWLLVPLVLSLLLLIGQIPRLSLASRIPLAFLAGISAAIAIGGAVFGTLIPQAKAVIGAFDPAVIYQAPEDVWLRILDAVVMLLGVIGTLSYFHFGRKLRPGKAEDDTKRPLALQGMSKVGEIFIGITLGAVFAGVFSTALLALIDRLIAIGDIVTQLLGGA
jgi:CBS domain containing-hemolysin-like protein